MTNRDTLNKLLLWTCFLHKAFWAQGWDGRRDWVIPKVSMTKKILKKIVAFDFNEVFIYIYIKKIIHLFYIYIYKTGTGISAFLLLWCLDLVSSRKNCATNSEFCLFAMMFMAQFLVEWWHRHLTYTLMGSCAHLFIGIVSVAWQHLWVVFSTFCRGAVEVDRVDVI